MPRLLAVLVTLVAASSIAPGVAAAADERAAARAFADAVIRAEPQLAAAVPQMKAELDKVDFEGCALALRHAPRRHEARALGLFTTAMVSAWLRPVMDPLRQLMADLDAVQTKDPTLRSGRAAWRKGYKFFGRVAADTDACPRLVAWRIRGWRRPPARPALSLQSAGEFGGTNRKMRRAVARLVKLGVPRRDAKRFSGDRLLEDAPTPDLEFDEKL
jgi:hypothetical protein